MKTFFIRRLLAAIPLIIVVTFITKALLVASPGNYLDTLRLNPSISTDYLERMERLYHLDSNNVFERYWFWFWPAIRGDFGYSLTKSAPVWSLIGERVLNTLLLTGSALVFSWFFAIPLGILAAVYRNRWIDRLIGFISFFGLSIPSVFFSLLMITQSGHVGRDDSLGKICGYDLASCVANDRTWHHRNGAVRSADAQRNDRDSLSGLHPHRAREGVE
jgi:peptide/nickel transport system permease protein